jgi:hypothetical protein
VDFYWSTPTRCMGGYIYFDIFCTSYSKNEEEREEVQNQIAWNKKEKKEEKRRKKVIQLFSHSLNKTGGDTKKEEEGKRSKYSRN